MPLDGSNNYYYPLGTLGVPNQTIESEKYNTFLDDLVMNDLNVPRPVSRGGTGASTPEQARTNLGVMSSDGGVMTGSITVAPSSGDTYLQLTKAASGDRAFIAGFTASNARWTVQLGNLTSETGSNAGSDFSIDRYDDAGDPLGVAMSISRATGATAINGNTTINGGLGVTGNIGAGGYLIVGGTSNTGIVRFGHETANYLSFDGTNYNLAGGPLIVGGAHIAGSLTGVTSLTTTGAATVGSVSSTGSGSFGNDVTINRAAIGVPAQGYLFFGNSGTRYFGYDGANLVCRGANLVGETDIIAGGTLIAQGGLVALNDTSTRFLQWNGTNYILPNAHLYVNGSPVWTDDFNGVSTLINAVRELENRVKELESAG